MTKPNFFIIGAPKAGTTALSSYLATHPEIFFSDPKDTGYFNRDFANRFVTRRDDYLDLFSGVTSRHSAIGEGSTRYMESRVAVPDILEFNPDARFVAMLRNPVEMVPALHSQYVYEGYEDVLDFEKAWRFQEDRKLGRRIPSICIEPKLVCYVTACLLGEQVERLYSVVPKDRVKLVFFEDFRSDSRGVYRDVLAFLGLQDDGRQDFPVVNRNKWYRSAKLQQTLYRLGAIKRILGIRRPLGLNKLVLRWNLTERPRNPLTADLRRELVEYFREDVGRLSEITGRELVHWLR